MISKGIGQLANRNTQVLFVIVLIAILLRVWGIGWGLPDVFEEATPMRMAWEFWGWETGKVDLNPHFFHYPAFYFYIQFVVQLFYYLFGLVVGLHSSLTDFHVHFQQDPSTVVLLSRLMTALLGVATVIIAYVLGKRLWSGTVGLLASFFLAFYTSHILYSQRISVDVPVTFLILCAYVFIYVVYERSNIRDYIFAGLFIGLATATKYTAAFLLIPLVVAHYLGHRRRKTSLWELVFDWRIGIGIAAAGLFFFLASPFCVIDFHSFWRDLSFERRHMHVGHFGQTEGGFSWSYYFLTSLRKNMGLPLQFLSLLGILYALFRHNRRDLLLLCFIFLYLVVVGSWSMRADRYLLPIVPFLLILAARFLHDLIQKTHRKPAFKEILTVIVAVAVILPAGVQVRDVLLTRAHVDTRTVAREWIEENIPQKSLVVLEPYTPKLDSKQYNYVHVPMLSMRPELSAPFYDMRWYRTSDYVIISSLIYNRYQRQPEKFSGQLDFYRDLENQFRLLKIFDEQDGYGPTIKIYENPIDTPIEATYSSEVFDSLFEKLGEAEFLPQEETGQFLSNLGTSFLQAGDLERSMRVLRKAEEIDPQNAAIHHNLAILYYEKELLQEAINECQEALAFNPKLIEMHFMLAIIYERIEQFEKAINQYTKVLEINRDFTDAYLRLGAIYEKQGNFSSAREVWERVLTIDPSNRQAMKRLKQLHEKDF